MSPMPVGGDQISARPIIFAPAICEASQRCMIASFVGNAPGKALRGTVREVCVDVFALAKNLCGVAGRTHWSEWEYEQPTDAPLQSLSRVACDEASWQGRECKQSAIDGPTNVRQGVSRALWIKVAVTQRPVRRHCIDCKLYHEATAEIRQCAKSRQGAKACHFRCNFAQKGIDVALQPRRANGCQCVDTR